MKREVSFWCAHCIDRSKTGWWIKNDTPVKCDGEPEKRERDGMIVTMPKRPCDRQADWVLIQDL